jgi:hypothetical protein
MRYQFSTLLRRARFVVACLALLPATAFVAAQTVNIPPTQPTVTSQPPPPVPSPNQPAPAPPVISAPNTVVPVRTIVLEPRVPAGTVEIPQTVPTVTTAIHATPTAPTPQAGTPAVAEALWQRLAEGGFVIFIRHARTDFNVTDAINGVTIGDCSTQRPLSNIGRDDMRALGATFRRRAIPVAKVYSSEFCRAVESAELAFAWTGLPVVQWDRLNFLSDPKLAPKLPEYTAEVRGFVSALGLNAFAMPPAALPARAAAQPVASVALPARTQAASQGAAQAAARSPVRAATAAPRFGNVIMMSHVTNTDPLLVGTQGLGLQEGEMAVLKPSKPGQFDYLGRIPIAYQR